MSTPTSRGQRGGSATRGGGRATPFQPTRGRGNSRGGATPSATVRGRGRGRGGAGTSTGDGLLQKLRAGTMQRGSTGHTVTSGAGPGSNTAHRGSFSSATTQARGRGRGRGFVSQAFNEAKTPPSATPSRTSSPAPSNQRDFMNAAIDRFTVLKQEREGERAQAIRDGFLADPDKKTSLDNAITPVGTCTDMCPPFERVERIVQNMVDKAEKVNNDDTGKDMPSEDRMVKRFRRSAAGYDEQLPSDIRTPETLRRTLDYLLNNIIGGNERLATVHKYVWDRTRGIRNDFSIQQVSRPEDVRIAVECYERIARFHILSLHQLANADNLWEGENFDAHQEREQLNNTLLSLLYYYDDHRQNIDFPNEGEFRAYCIIFEMQSQNPDLEDRVQSWPKALLQDRRVKTALKLYKAAGNTLFDQGPLRPMETFAIAQNNSGSFWQVLSSNAVPYIMACVAEIYFGPIRFAGLDALWHSAKSAPAGQQARSRDWSLLDLTTYLHFDTEEETKDFCGAFELDFTADGDAEYLDPTSNGDANLDQSSIPRQQSFSHDIVEKKRYRRSLTAVINGASVAQAIREGWVEADDELEAEQTENHNDEQSLFVPEGRSFGDSTSPSIFGTGLNPAASIFKPAATPSSPVEKVSSFGQPTNFAKFGIPAPPSSSTPTFGLPTTQTASQPENGSTVFGTPAAEERKPFSTFGQPTNATAPTVSQSFAFGSSTQSAPSQPPSTPSPPSFGTFGVAKKDEPSAAAPVQQQTFSGFNFGKAPSTTSLAPAPAPIAQEASIAATGSNVTASTGIFNSSTPTFPSFPPGSLRSPDDSTTISTTPSAAPPTNTQFKFPTFNFANPSDSSKPSVPSNLPATQPPLLYQQASSHNQSATSEPVSGSQPARFPSVSSQSFPQFSPSSPPPPATLAAPTPQSTLSITQNTSTASKAQSPESQSSTHSSVGNNSSQTFNCPSVEPPITTSAAPVDKKAFTQKPLNASSTTPKAPSPLRNAFSAPQSQVTTSPDPSVTQKERERLTKDFARVALLKQNGLIQQYIEYNLPEIVKSVFNWHHREIHLAAVASIRERIMKRKFANLWRSLTWNKILRRRANSRRQQFSETIRAIEDKQKKADEELQAIMAAVQETKRVQREMQDKGELDQEVKGMLAARKKAYEASHNVQKVAGQKRKSLSSQDNPRDTNGAVNPGPSTPSHKRSRTLGTLSAPSNSSLRYAKPVPGAYPPAGSPSVFSQSSLLGRSSSNHSLRQSVSSGRLNNDERPKLDTTKTDYFRLKALGIDPETPLVPLTDKQVESKRRRDAEEKQRQVDNLKRRRYYGGSFRPQASPSPPPTVSEVSPTVSSPLEPVHNEPKTKTKRSIQDDDDDLLERARAQRKELETGTNWLRDTRLQLDKQIDQEVERRIGEELSARSVHSTANKSPNGLARANGYEYLPAPTQPGLPLSRTEQRIRATGARGLAFKPLRSHADYVPVGVAMSKRSASKYSGELTSQQVSSPLRSVSLDHRDVDPAIHGSAKLHKNFVSQKAVSKKRPYDASEDEEEHESYRPAPPKSQYHSHHAPADAEEESAEEYEEDGGGRGGYDEGDDQYDDEEEEEELEEDDDLYEDEDDGFDLDNQPHSNGSYSLPPEEFVDDGRSPSTNAVASRAASSAPGASADDAFVLSDSD